MVRSNQSNSLGNNKDYELELENKNFEKSFDEEQNYQNYQYEHAIDDLIHKKNDPYSN